MPSGRNAPVKYVKRTRSKGLTYYYFDTGQLDEKGKKIFKRIPDPRSREFGPVYAALIGHRTRRANAKSVMTVERLVELYMESPHFSTRSPATRKIYGIYLAEFTSQFGPAPAGGFARTDMVQMMDRMASRPGAANMVLSCVRAVYTWGRDRGHVDTDPARDIQSLEVGEHDPWPQAAIAAALAAEDGRVRLGVHLLYFTAQRISDVVRMRWDNIEDGFLVITPMKTKRSKTQLQIRVHSKLQAELEKVDRNSDFILAGADGKPMSDRTLRTMIQGFCKDLGWDVVPHGLRKSAVNALLEAGCSVAETASISGQSLTMVEHYAKRRNVSRLSSSAMSKWESGEGASGA